MFNSVSSMDIGLQTIDDCYFLKTGREFPFSLPEDIIDAIEHYNRRNEMRFIFTYNDRSSIYDRLVSVIKDARKNIKMVAYELDHKGIINLLVEKAKELKGGVYLITNLDKELRDYLLEEESPRREFIEEIRTLLAKGGVYQRGLDAHTKLTIIDNKTLFVLSANITRKALGDVEEKLGNFEVSLEIRDNRILELAKKYFAYLWFDAKLEIQPNTAEAIVVRRRSSPIKLKILQELEKRVEYELDLFWKGKLDKTFVYLKPQRSYLYSVLMKMIKKAKKEIIISTYNFVAPPEDLIRNIIGALRRNVRIKLLIKPMNFRDDQRSSLYSFLQKIRKFREKVTIAGLPINHAKYVVIDREIVLISSMNIDGRHIDNGHEAGVIVRDSTLGNILGALTDYLLENASHVVAYRPRLIDLAYKTDNQPIITDKLLIRVTTKESPEEIKRELKSKLVAIYQHELESGYVLRVGDKFYRITIDPEKHKVENELTIVLKSVLRDISKLRFRGYLLAKNLEMEYTAKSTT